MLYTKTGDNGTTSLVGGERVPKDDPRVEAYGTVDELNAHIALLAEQMDQDDRQFLKEIQKVLFNIQTLLATPDESLRNRFPQITEEDVNRIEQHINELCDWLPKLDTFVLPGGSPAAAQSHVARCVCRRAERRIVTLNGIFQTADNILVYLNRLSDYLFVLSRKLAVMGKGEETILVG